jgi:hypothetical protein
MSVVADGESDAVGGRDGIRIMSGTLTAEPPVDFLAVILVLAIGERQGEWLE